MPFLILYHLLLILHHQEVLSGLPYGMGFSLFLVTMGVGNHSRFFVMSVRELTESFIHLFIHSAILVHLPGTEPSARPWMSGPLGDT